MSNRDHKPAVSTEDVLYEAFTTNNPVTRCVLFKIACKRHDYDAASKIVMKRLNEGNSNGRSEV